MMPCAMGATRATHYAARFFAAIALLLMLSAGCDRAPPVTEPAAPEPTADRPGTTVSLNLSAWTLPELQQSRIDRFMADLEEFPGRRLLIGAPQACYPLLRPVLPGDGRELPAWRLDTGAADGPWRLYIRMEPGEHLWGFGPEADAFNLRGRPASPAVPFYLSSHGYGLFVNSRHAIHFDPGQNRPGEMVVTLPAQQADVIYFHGPPAAIVQAYTRLVGRPGPLPDWIFAPWLARHTYYGQHEINGALDRMAAGQMAVGAILLEQWAQPDQPFQFDPDRYPFPISWIRQLQHHQAVRTLCSVPLPPAGSGSADPDALTAWRDGLAALGRAGVGGVRLHADPATRDAPAWPSHEADRLQSIARDALQREDGDGVLLSDFMNPLTPALSLVRTRETHSDWTGLSSALRRSLSAALSGFPLYVHEVGGNTGIPEKPLYLRWLQLGALSPVFHLHGPGGREPWPYDQDTVEIAQFYFALRQRLQPRLEEWGRAMTADGTPILRPMCWHAPDDPGTYALDDQFMLGPDLLVAPILDASGVRSIYLPEGDWIHLWDRVVQTGPRTIDHAAELHQIPLWVRAEAIEQYRHLLDGAPDRRTPLIHTRLLGTPDERGLVPLWRYPRHGAELELTCRITNHYPEPQALSVRLAPAAGIDVTPRQFVRFLLDPDTSQDVTFSYHVRPALPPGSYPLRLEVRSPDGDHPGPVVGAVVSPVWQVLGPLPGGVGAPHALNPEVVDLDAAHQDHAGRPVAWRPVPDEAIRPDGMIDLSAVSGAPPGTSTYLHAVVPADLSRWRRIWAGSGDGLTVWVNGRELLHRPVRRNPLRDEDRIDAVLTGGDNEVLVRISHEQAPAGFYFRIE